MWTVPRSIPVSRRGSSGCGAVHFFEGLPAREFRSNSASISSRRLRSVADLLAVLAVIVRRAHAGGEFGSVRARAPRFPGEGVELALLLVAELLRGLAGRGVLVRRSSGAAPQRPPACGAARASRCSRRRTRARGRRLRRPASGSRRCRGSARSWLTRSSVPA